ncbi:MAG: bifunctional phosphopantothenoylcysteine decarboxylase/phosphopantothenate--cysteine ligase CoaBC [Chloroflexi bacterium]|nr:bifunctional phosphopantothenoylcysteine decarboxylase/phosphopantothenate--cysteine ligase CoaBC [Chloroflexota bacterium]
MLAGRRVVVGVCGGIAAYKVADLASQLVKAGAEVDVVMTRAAQEFVTPLTFQSLTHRPVLCDVFDAARELAVPHVALAARAEVVLVAPATANTLARLAHGLADDMLTCTVLATRAPVVLAPAMEEGMYAHAATQANLALLRERGCRVVEPTEGRLASGKVGRGRLAEVPALLAAVRAALGARGDLAGRRIVVTAGGTHEPIDPVRFVGNRSSGKMGFALAEAARDRGACVTLIAGPTTVEPPPGVALFRVETAVEMCDAVLSAVRDADALVMAAAVADYRPAALLEQKIKRSSEELTVRLVRNPDILARVAQALAGRPLVSVGFAAETQDVRANARLKLAAKGLDLIVANDVTAPDSGFGTDTNCVVLVDAASEEELPLLSKYEVAWRVLDRVARQLAAQR